ncbi:MAG: exodeoxyribonuclease VII small subunit [Ignavibacteriaceae bacterium]|jgi:exodeoxyribonuclease VII small subunit
MKKKTNQSSFKTDLQRLEEISIILDSGEIDLEDAIALYEEGMLLSKKCLTTLSEAELKVTELKSKIDVTDDNNF